MISKAHCLHDSLCSLLCNLCKIHALRTLAYNTNDTEHLTYIFRIYPCSFFHHLFGFGSRCRLYPMHIALMLNRVASGSKQDRSVFCKCGRCRPRQNFMELAFAFEPCGLFVLVIDPVVVMLKFACGSLADFCDVVLEHCFFSFIQRLVRLWEGQVSRLRLCMCRLRLGNCYGYTTYGF